LENSRAALARGARRRWFTGGTITIPRTARQDVGNRHGDLRERINIHDDRTMM
jgi:hypothetical protein